MSKHNAIKLFKTLLKATNPREALMELVFSQPTSTSFKWDPRKTARENFELMLNIFVAEGRMTREKADAFLNTDPDSLDIRELIPVEEGSEVDEVLDMVEIQRLTRGR